MLAAGHTVRATVRNLNREDLIAPLKALDGADERLSFHTADLLTPGAFDAVIDGCKYVIHPATPFITGARDPQREIVDPALLGVRNVIESVNKASSVERLVLTSSTLAMSVANDLDEPPYLIQEDSWNRSANLQNSAYSHAKREQEQLAWKLVKEQDRWDLVSINPAMVVGPSVATRTDGVSVDIVYQFATGKLPFVPRVAVGVCDVRSVAVAHCVAAVNPKCSGRYIISSSRSYDFLDLARSLKDHFPQMRVPTVTAWYWVFWLLGPLVGLPRAELRYMWCEKQLAYETRRSAEDLGMDDWFIPMQKSMVDMVESLIERGIVKYSGSRVK